MQFNVKDSTYQKCENIKKCVFPFKLKQIRTFLNEKSKSLARDLATLHTANAEIDNLLHPFLCAANLKYMGVSCQLLSTAHDRLLLRAEHNAIKKQTLEYNECHCYVHCTSETIDFFRVVLLSVKKYIVKQKK